MDTVAALQYGWSENYTLAKKLFTNEKFIAQQAQWLQDAIDQLNGTPAAQPDTTTQPAQPAAAQPQQQFPSGTLTPDQMKAIKAGAYVEGADDAKFTIVEYSDPECPFCIRHHNDKTIKNTMDAFPWAVNHIYKVVQWVNHVGTEYKSLAILCAWKIKGEEAYVWMYDKILSSSTTSTVVPNEKILEFAKELAVDTTALQECITKWDTKSIYAANWAEFGTLTSSRGTPWNIVINNETGEWKLVAWAYPVDTFKQIITEWTK